MKKGFAMKTYECEQLTIGAGCAEALSVDDDAKVIRGFVVAQLGPFKTQGRGEFDERSLKQIVRLMGQEPSGLASNYGHVGPNELGKFLGRAREPRIETIKVKRNGERLQIP